MKFLFFTPTLGNGGAESHLARLANGLVDDGHEVTICVARGGGSYESWIRDSIKLVTLTKGVRSSTLSLLVSLIPLMGALKRTKPDIAVSFLNNTTAILYVAWWLTGKLGKLVIGIQNNFSAEIRESSWWYQFSFKPITIIAFKRADHLIALSEGVKQNLLNVHLKGCRPADSITTIHNICLDDITAKLREAVLPIERPAGNLLLAAGRLGKQKDYPVLLEAAKLLKDRADYTLWILGKGPLEDELKAYVKSNDLEERVIFLGFQKNPFPFFAAADIFVLSSRWEGFGNVIVEAMSVGTVVASTDCDYGPAEITENGRYGMLSPVGDAAALANNIETLLRNPERRAELSKDSIKRAQDFHQHVITAHYIKTFSEVMD